MADHTPKQRRPAQDALSEAELEQLLAAVSTASTTGKRNLALLTLMADTGLRRAEVLDLQTADLRCNDGGAVITHLQVTGKGRGGGKAAEVPLTTRAAARLAVWLEARRALRIRAGHVFCTVSRGRHVGLEGERELKPGKPLTPVYVNQLVARAAARAGIERRVTPHTLRHTFATHMIRRYGIAIAQKALRHAYASTTSAVYSHLTDRDVELAVRGLRETPEQQPPADDELQERIAAIEAQFLSLKQRFGGQ